MKSHDYTFSRRDLLPLIALPLVPVALFAVLAHLGAATRVLPHPQPALDTDRTILLHQSHTSLQSGSTAEVVLIGDSSCLMDVSAVELTRCLPNQASTLNLGTLSYIDLHSYAEILERYLSNNSNHVRTVVLLMNPLALRQAAPSDYHVEALNRFYTQQDFGNPAGAKILSLLGVDIFRGRLLSRLIPVALDGAYGKKYGFTTDLWNYLTTQQGSALDPGRYSATESRGLGEYRLARGLESASQAFRRMVPTEIKLCVGITPLPEGEAGRGFSKIHGEMLERWSQWLQADEVLTQLPATLSDRLFASEAHLNEEGQKLYTGLLCDALSHSVIRGR